MRYLINDFNPNNYPDFIFLESVGYINDFDSIDCAVISPEMRDSIHKWTGHTFRELEKLYPYDFHHGDIVFSPSWSIVNNVPCLSIVRYDISQSNKVNQILKNFDNNKDERQKRTLSDIL